MTGFHEGGFIEGGDGGIPLTIERIGVGIDGMCLYSFNDGPPERVFSAKDIRRLGAAELIRRMREARGDAGD